MKKAMLLTIIFAIICILSGTAFADSYMATTDLQIMAVINTVEKGPVDAVWQKGGEDTTSRGDRVIWGHFYASPSDVTWGSLNNPDLFVKIWYDVSGRVDVNFFHVSVPDITVYSDYPFDGTVDEQGTTTMSRRYIRQYYEGGQSNSEDSYEDGVPAAGYTQTNNPLGYSTINNLGFGSMINTVEKGPVEAVWRFGGQDTTARGDQVVWGHFYASPSDVTWGSSDNPDLYVKIWFDVSGRIDVNFFHVSVPDIEVYSDYPDNGIYDQTGTTIMADRYIRHEYGSGATTTYNIAEYFPIGQGDTWTYNNAETHLISGTEAVNGVIATKMITDVANGDTYLLFDIYSGALRFHKIVDLDDIAGCGWSWTVFNPPAIMMPAELSIGGIHTTSTTASYENCAGLVVTQTITHEGTLEAVEDVTVPAGTFKNCLRYKMVTLNIPNDQGVPSNAYQTWWMAKGVGLVKTIENGRTEELINATVGGVSYP